MDDAPTTPTVTSKDTLSTSSKMLLVMLAILPAVFATGFASFTYFQRTLALILAGLTLILWGVESLRANQFKLFSGRAILPLGLLGLWCALSALWSSHPIFGILDTSTIIAATVGAIILASPTCAPVQGKHLTSAIAISVLGTGLWGILDFAGVDSLFNLVWNPTGPTGSFDSAEMATAFYAVSLPWLAIGAGALKGKGRILTLVSLLAGGFHLAVVNMQWWPLIAIAAGVVGASVLFASRGVLQSKGAVLSLGAGALVLGAAALGPATLAPKPELYNTATTLPVVESFAPELAEEAMQFRQPRDLRFSTFRPESNDHPLIRDYVHGLWSPMVKKQPLLGLGAGGWWIQQDIPARMEHPLKRENFTLYPIFRSPHNSVVKLLTEQGVIGLLLLLLALGSTLWIAVKLTPAAVVQEESDSQATPHMTLAWAATAALLSGAVMMWNSSLLELAPAALLWFVAMATIAQLGAQEASPSSWAQTWSSSSRPISAGLVGILVAAGILTLGALDLASSYNRGMADQFMVFGRYEKAREAYRKSWALLPAHADNLYNYTQASQRIGDMKSRFAMAEPLIGLRPNDARYRMLRGYQYQQRREYKKAIKQANLALHLNPNDYTASNLLAVAQNRTLDFKSATATLEHLLQFKGLPPQEQAVVHEQAGQMYEGPMGQPQDSLKHYEKAYKMSSSTVVRTRLKAKLEDIDKRVTRERLIREGKPVPAELMPVQKHNEAEHILSGPQGHKHAPTLPGAPGQGSHQGHQH